MLSFWREEKSLKGGKRKPISSAYTYGESDPWSITESEGYTTWDAHFTEDDHNGKLACAFIRGLRIAISPTAWEEYLPTEISDSIYNIPSGSLTDVSTVTPDSFVRSLRKVHPEISQNVKCSPLAGMTITDREHTGHLPPFIHHHPNDASQGMSQLSTEPPLLMGLVDPEEQLAEACRSR